MSMARQRLLNRNYLCVLIHVVCMNLGFNMLSTIATPYALTLGTGLTMAGFSAGILSITAMCIRPVAGLISDTFEMRKLLLICSLGIAVLIFGYTVSGNIRVLLALRVLHGVLFGVVSTATMAVTRNCIPSARLGEGMGYYGVAQALASVIGPNLGLSLADSVGYTATFLTAAVLTTIAGGVLLLLNIEGGQEKRLLARRDRICRIFIPVQVTPFLPVCFVLGSIGGLDGSFLPLYARQEGISSIGWYFTLQAVALVGAKLLLGKASDKLPFRIVLLIGSGLIGGAFALLGILNPEYGVFLLVFAAIFRATGVGLLQPAVQAACFKAVAPGHGGAASAAYMLGMDLGVGSAPIIGALLQEHVGFSGMYLSYFLPLVISVAVFYTFSGRKGGKT